MAVRRRGNTYQVDFSFKNKRYRHDCASDAEAWSWEADARAKLIRGESLEVGNSGERSSCATLGLKWEDVAANRLTLHPGETKNDGGRSVDQTDRVKAVLDRRFTTHPKGETRVFWDLTQDSVRHLWDKMRDALHPDDAQFVPHCLRHTVASRLVQAGRPLSFVQRFMGHKSITVTMRYAHLAPNNLEDCTTLLNNHANGLNYSPPSLLSHDTNRDKPATSQPACDKPVMRIAQ